MKFEIAAVGVLLAGSVALAGCGGGGTSPTAAATTPAAASPAQPATAAGARSAASQYFALYSAGEFAASWALLNPAVQRAIPQRVWVAVHEGCAGASAGLAYHIKNVMVDQDTAVVAFRLAGARPGLASGTEAFAYAGGRWGYMPADMGLYRHGSVAKDIAAAKARGLCAG